MEMNYHYNPENSFPQDGNFVACLGFMGLYYAEHILRKKKKNLLHLFWSAV